MLYMHTSLRLQVAAGADPQAALAAAARSSPGNLVVFGTNNGFFEDQKAAGDRCLGFRGRGLSERRDRWALVWPTGRQCVKGAVVPAVRACQTPCIPDVTSHAWQQAHQRRSVQWATTAAALAEREGC
jgi:hypothetical protein